MELALAEVIEQTTASGPEVAAMSCKRLPMSSSASSQLTRCQPGSVDDLGWVLRSGYKSRSALWTISGAARPFGQRALPVGWAGFGLTSTSLPSSITLIEPQRERQNVQYPATSRRAMQMMISELRLSAQGVRQVDPTQFQS